jgi:hypothetical protein
VVLNRRGAGCGDRIRADGGVMTDQLRRSSEMIQSFLDGEHSDFVELTEALSARVVIELLDFPLEVWKQAQLPLAFL